MAQRSRSGIPVYFVVVFTIYVIIIIIISLTKMNKLRYPRPRMIDAFRQNIFILCPDTTKFRTFIDSSTLEYDAKCNIGFPYVLGMCLTVRDVLGNSNSFHIPFSGHQILTRIFNCRINIKIHLKRVGCSPVR